MNVVSFLGRVAIALCALSSVPVFATVLEESVPSHPIIGGYSDLDDPHCVEVNRESIPLLPASIVTRRYTNALEFVLRHPPCPIGFDFNEGWYRRSVDLVIVAKSYDLVPDISGIFSADFVTPSVVASSSKKVTSELRRSSEKIDWDRVQASPDDVASLMYTSCTSLNALRFEKCERNLYETFLDNASSWSQDKRNQFVKAAVAETSAREK